MDKQTSEFMMELYQLIDKYVDRGMSILSIISVLQIVAQKMINMCINGADSNDDSDFKIDGGLK